MGKVSAYIDPEFLAISMGLPKNNKIVDAVWEKGSLLIFVEGDDLPEEVVEGAAVMRVTPTITVETDRKGKVLSKNFSWNLPK